MKFPRADLSSDEWKKLRLHISDMWPRLTRDLKHAVQACRDPKSDSTDETMAIYVSALESAPEITNRLKKILAPADFSKLEVIPLPSDSEGITRHGLLYLPGRYVVPGGRFNELYGWESYFIALGLLRDNRINLAQSVADQCLYEIRHYGTVLSCNRTYSLERSNPPYLSQLVRRVFEHTGDVEWLRGTVPLLEQYYGYWLSGLHFNPSSGLSRYHSPAEGPATEVEFSERDESGLTHYQRVCNLLNSLGAPSQWLKSVHDAASDAVPAGANNGPAPWLSRVYDIGSHSLTAEGFKNDRSVRESGLHPTHRFGVCGLDCVDYLPVCLNTLLWCMEKDIASFCALTGSSDKDIQRWETAAANRLIQMNELFWDPLTGLFHDWNHRREERSDYAFATTFMPLWAGWATEKQAQAVASNLPDFMGPGGLLTSCETTGCQWDAPFTWAPLVFMASRGLARYGFRREADDVALRFLSLAAQEFQRTGNLFEKYDANDLTSEVSGKILFGYPTNETGFGPTNGVIAELMGDRMPSRPNSSLLRHLRLLPRRTRCSPDGEKLLGDV